ncbi:Dual specificity protein phosphatase [Pyrenophora tritici-repentis]|uniref:protein-tyrosine-phosphatase n=1 Tax=Pyrenophora tritici-repentis TaxID=45151 RepID=A0A922SXS3_9PLEO|nr:Dual specificity protein phosphatase [Pyrenophora tritici-repentis]KAI1669829.1 Dual specificity protein phosphatase [Pyrenophora tritici-repentis]KAI1681416.1 Dual specificity protein phosphatase [Pyrenophora tritici-repentis]
MALIDRVPGDLNLYIGGIFTLRRREALEQAKITHVLSVLRTPSDQSLFSPFKHMVVEVDDVDDENLLEHFPATNAFIREGLKGGGGVLVHCHSYQYANQKSFSSAMGKSRSATVVIAYLMHEHNISPSEALSHLRQARSICEPNDGFMKQLELYGKMQTPEDVESTPAYQRWVYQREIELSRACGQAPEADKIRFEDEHVTDEASGFELRCRKCRRALATSKYLLSHGPRSTVSNEKAKGPSAAAASQNCAHYFLDPLSWMRPELEQGKLEGRLECPNQKCRNNVGKYAWQGMQCSCGEWVVPGISLAKGRIDEARKANFGIRRPPGAVSGPPPLGAPHAKQNL